MGFSLSERYVTVLNLLLIGALAYLAAQTVNQVIAWRLSGNATAQPLPPPRPPAPERSVPRSHYDLIVDRDIFNAPAPPSAPVVEDLHLKLIGTSLIKHSKPYAVVEDERNGQESLYKLGEEIPDAGKLAAVESDRIIIEHEGRRIAVEMPATPAPEPVRQMFPGPLRMPAAPGMRGPRGAVRRMGGNRFVVDRSAAEQSLSNMGDLLTQMRATPNVDNGGRTDGFKISEVQPGSLFEQMGLRNGDVIQSIDGHTLDDPARALDMLRTLSDQQSVTISLMRGGSPVQFQYEMH